MERASFIRLETRNKEDPNPMARPVVLYPDPRLKMKSRMVTAFDQGLKTLAAEMTQTMREANGLGLAAVQVGELLRFMVMEEHFDREDRGESLALVNPEILSTEGVQLGEEGCLSLPDVREDLERPYRVTLKAQNLEGVWKEYTFEALLARCVLHEMDHMNGQLFIERLPAVKRLLLRTRLKELRNQFNTAAKA
jgi:peptide deformylase